jgi:hypothetical protein
MQISLALPVAASFLLFAAGCQLPPTRAATQADRPTVTDAGLSAVPECAAGASATLADGLQVGYVGSDPHDPQRCLVEWSDRSHSLYFGFWSPSLERPISEQAREAFSTALTGPVGMEATFNDPDARMWRAVTVTHVDNSVVDVAGRQRAALELRVVRHDALGRPGVRAETRYTIDRATGVLLRSENVTPMADGGVSTTTGWQIGTLDQAG